MGIRPGSTADLVQGGGVHAASGDADNPFRCDVQVHYMTRNWDVMDLVTHGNEFLRQYCRRTGARPLDTDTGLGFPPDTVLYTGGWDSRRPIIRQEPREPVDAWYARIDLSVLSPFTVRLIDNAASLILRRAITIEGNPYWRDFSEDVDGWGSSINEFARRILRSSLTYGHAGLLVDFPPFVDVANLTQERAIPGRRPYFVSYDAPHILGWRQAAPYPTAPMSQVRLFERTTLPEGMYGQTEVEQCRVITPDQFMVYRRTPGGADAEAIPPQGGANTLGAIPFVPLYTNRTGFLTSMPPLVDIAELNLTHYQKQADQLHALHIAAMPQLVLEGWSEMEASTAKGVNFALNMDPGNKAYYINADASSFNAQEAKLASLEAQMSTLGVTKLLGQKFVAESADAKRVDQAQANSVMAIISLELQSVLNQAYGIAARYLNISPPTISIDRDFDFYRLLGQDVGVLADATKEGLVSPEMWVKTLKQGEWYSDTADLDAEIAYVEENMTTAKEDMAQQQQMEAERAERLSEAMANPQNGQEPAEEDSDGD